MRIALFLVALSACSGPAKTAPPPSNQKPVADTPPAPNPTLQQPTCSGGAGCAMQHMEYFQLRMCNCKDKACADATNNAMTQWGTEMAKKAHPDGNEKPDPALIKRSVDVMTRYTECMTKLMIGTPPPNPCGDADPCGHDPCGG